MSNDIQRAIQAYQGDQVWTQSISESEIEGGEWLEYRNHYILSSKVILEERLNIASLVFLPEFASK